MVILGGSGLEGEVLLCARYVTRVDMNEDTSMKSTIEIYHS